MENIIAQEKIDLSQVSNIAFDNLDKSDAHDFSDTFIISASYKGRAMTEEELDRLNENSGFIYKQILKFVY